MSTGSIKVIETVNVSEKKAEKFLSKYLEKHTHKEMENEEEEEEVEKNYSSTTISDNIRYQLESILFSLSGESQIKEEFSLMNQQLYQE